MSKWLITYQQYYQNRQQYAQQFTIIVESDTAENAKLVALNSINTNTTNAYAKITQSKGALTPGHIPEFRVPGAVNIVTKVTRIRGT